MDDHWSHEPPPSPPAPIPPAPLTLSATSPETPVPPASPSPTASPRTSGEPPSPPSYYQDLFIERKRLSTLKYSITDGVASAVPTQPNSQSAVREPHEVPTAGLGDWGGRRKEVLADCGHLTAKQILYDKH